MQIVSEKQLILRYSSQGLELEDRSLREGFTSQNGLMGFFLWSFIIIILMTSIAIAGTNDLPQHTRQMKQSSLAIEQVETEFYLPEHPNQRLQDIEKLYQEHPTALDIELSFRSKIVMSDAQEQMLLNGIPLTFVYEVRIEKPGLFWATQSYMQEIHYRLYYHGLSKQFVVRNLENGKQHSYPTLSLAILSISTPTDIEFHLEDSAGLVLKEYQGRAKLWLDIEALPTPLRIPAYLSPNWWLNSQWFKWEF
ncbi:hypothetical protein DC083_00270 [Ignatzschineria ureiclastica]|uniref:DUF4390 domain-containing protein n=1 Tax=Ignatzschineria ureiclastica TaxID=472582 RepID=A0A2U2AGA3_9GAMM|nr:DUF4390 domain-containing protein [Ignatzschineria ureiclastica]PWD81670.1 hypothetical protein DC083_00270 [Ignatzschineria ureiclastica]GGZ89795.1 hypothetical protein GCM10007162_00530 [Ignatzschineria ureiclastica]